MITVYDRVRWHYPEGRGCESMASALRHFETLMGWLARHELLSEEGCEAMDCINSQFALTSELVTARGRRLLDRYYQTWLAQIDYDASISMDRWDRWLESIDTVNIVKPPRSAWVRS